MKGLSKSGLVGGHTLDYNFKGNFKIRFPELISSRMDSHSETFPHFNKSVKK